jgi:predicted DCC family thiol-disulfide oxidoreductase YuxK
MSIEEIEKLSFDHPIAVYDGQCFLCHRAIQIILNNDKHNVVKFLRIQDDSAKQIFEKLNYDWEKDETVFLILNGEYFTHSDFTIELSRYLKFPYRLFSVIKIVPRKIRNIVYRWIANNRYKWFGKSETCIILTKEMQEKLLN